MGWGILGTAVFFLCQSALAWDMALPKLAPQGQPSAHCNAPLIPYRWHTPAGTWDVTEADIDYGIGVVKYNNNNRTAFWKNILVVYAPALSNEGIAVYASDDLISQVKISMIGSVSFVRRSAHQTDLIVCEIAQEPVTGAYYYPCAASAGAMTGSGLTQVETLAHTQPGPIVGSLAPDGDYTGADWNITDLAFSRTDWITRNHVVKTYDSTTHTLTTLATTTTSRETPMLRPIFGGEITYETLSFPNGIFAPAASQYFSIPYQSPPTQYWSEPNAGSLAIATSAPMGQETHRFFSKHEATGFGYDLYFKTSADGFSTDHLAGPVNDGHNPVGLGLMTAPNTLGAIIAMGHSGSGQRQIHTYAYDPVVQSYNYQYQIGAAEGPIGLVQTAGNWALATRQQTWGNEFLLYQCW